jgi:hypothetical protein
VAHKIILCEDLENMLNRAVYGSRLVDKGDYRRQTNILSIIQSLSKQQGFERVLESYEFLCEIAHPNVMGERSILVRFWWRGARRRDRSDSNALRQGQPRIAKDRGGGSVGDRLDER